MMGQELKSWRISVIVVAKYKRVYTSGPPLKFINFNFELCERPDQLSMVWTIVKSNLIRPCTERWQALKTVKLLLSKALVKAHYCVASQALKSLCDWYFCNFPLINPQISDKMERSDYLMKLFSPKNKIMTTNLVKENA